MNEQLKVWMETVTSIKAPLIEIIGNRRVLIENHSGIKEYSSERITVKKQGGSISVTGESLQLAAITNERIIITGNISSVELSKERGACGY